MSFITIILLFTAPQNSARPTMMLANSIGPLATSADAQSPKSITSTVTKAPFSSQIRPFSPELYDMSAFGDHEVHSD